MSCEEDVEKDYKSILNETIKALKNYYAGYSDESKKALKKLNESYILSLQKARSEIEQYIEAQGVNLVKHLDEIKKISDKERMKKAPHAYIINITRSEQTTSGIETAYPINQMDNSSQWVEYKVEYDKDVCPTSVKWDKLYGIPVYTIPDGIVEYRDEMRKGKRENGAYTNEIFQLAQGDKWKNTLKNELPIGYSLSYIVIPEARKKDGMDDLYITNFKEQVEKFKIYKDMMYNVVDSRYLGTITATKYLNEIMKKSWDAGRTEVKAYNVEMENKERNKINEFRNQFSLYGEAYTDDQILKSLQENDFNFENAFSALCS